VIDVRRLTVSFQGLAALDDLNLQVREGECLLLTGPSGCGKSTLARAVCGLIPKLIPAQMGGQVRVAGLDVRSEPLARISQRVGMVFQNPAAQLFHLRVEDEIAFGPRNLGLDEAQVQARVDWALKAAGIESLRQRRPAQLSGGQKQIVAIAAVLAMRPRLLVLDEPTASLDVPSTRRVMDTLRALKERHGITILLIEHRLAEGAQLADRAAIMEQGRLIMHGPPEQVFQDREVRRRLGLRRMSEWQVTPWQNLIRPNGHRSQEAPPLLALEGLTAGYDKQPVIRDIDLQIYPGDFTALVGDNGAGKTTLALAAAGLLKPWRGRVRYRGGRKPQPGRDIMLLFQNPADQLFTDSVDEEVAFGPHNYGCYSPADHQQTLAQADLLDLRHRRPTAISVGQQQRTALAACMALRPRLLILDEPTLGQDWGHLQRLMDYLRELNQKGTAILLISHDYKLVHRYARRVILLDGGTISARGHFAHDQSRKEHKRDEVHNA
jgi:energy-coupling factor transporter ATP-binding protein EcfA2